MNGVFRKSGGNLRNAENWDQPRKKSEGTASSGGLNFRPEIGAAGSILSKYDEVVALVEAARGVILSRGRPRGTARS